MDLRCFSNINILINTLLEVTYQCGTLVRCSFHICLFVCFVCHFGVKSKLFKTKTFKIVELILVTDFLHLRC